MSGFRAKYGVDDGYAGKSRPQSFSIDRSEIEEDMTVDELKDLYEEEMMNAFWLSVTPYGENMEEFVEWAKEIQKEKRG